MSGAATNAIFLLIFLSELTYASLMFTRANGTRPLILYPMVISLVISLSILQTFTQEIPMRVMVNRSVICFFTFACLFWAANKRH